jgi:hypothetical protein
VENMLRLLNLFELIKVDKYYKMKQKDLELEANKYNIGEYYDGNKVLRSQIIKQLLEKDLANNSQFAIFVSSISIILSLINLYITLKK